MLDSLKLEVETALRDLGDLGKGPPLAKYHGSLVSPLGIHMGGS